MKEKEIRPKKLFNKFLYLASKDIKKYFKGKKDKVKCVACKSSGKFTFNKKNFSYYLCSKCRTLYANPRPQEKAFINYYTQSSSIKFLANTLYKKTKEARRKKIWVPKAKIIIEKLKKNKIKNSTFIDIGGGFGSFAEEISKYKKNVVVIEPSPFMAQECRKKKINVIQKFLELVKKEDLPKDKKCFTCFELFEHLYDPSKFVKNLRKLMNNGDLFIFTTLSSLGADILALWNNSRSISPPHHINFFNPYSISTFLKKHNFKIIDISTPGKIDVDILENDKHFIKDKFWKNFFKFATKRHKKEMQEFISNHNLSSHMMVVCKK